MRYCTCIHLFLEDAVLTPGKISNLQADFTSDLALGLSPGSQRIVRDQLATKLIAVVSDPKLFPEEKRFLRKLDRIMESIEKQGLQFLEREMPHGDY